MPRRRLNGRWSCNLCGLNIARDIAADHIKNCKRFPSSEKILNDFLEHWDMDYQELLKLWGVEDISEAFSRRRIVLAVGSDLRKQKQQHLDRLHRDYIAMIGELPKCAVCQIVISQAGGEGEYCYDCIARGKANVDKITHMC